MIWGYSSVVEHLTADQEVPSSNLGAPSLYSLLQVLAFISHAIFCLELTLKNK